MDWNKKELFNDNRKYCHSLCGSVDWNMELAKPLDPVTRHSLCGSVDWNCLNVLELQANPSHSLCGSVDWNSKRKSGIISTVGSLPVRECGLKYKFSYMLQVLARHSLCGSVDWNCYGAGHTPKIQVTPCAGVWIEINFQADEKIRRKVTPYVGVWIEIRLIYRVIQFV